MKWTPGGESQDIEDRRDDSGGGDGGGGFQFGGAHIGIGGAILLLVLSFVFHANFFALLSGGGAPNRGPGVGPSPAVNGPRSPGQPHTARDEAEKPEVQFVSFVLDDTQRTWTTLLPDQSGKPYRHAHLVLYRNSTYSGCGGARAATGPFYCPEDEKVYLDLEFFDELKRRFGAPGEFAQAYVIAHELGHHIQKILGIEQKVSRLQQQDPRQQNPLSVRLELQADCFAGIWAHSTQQRGLVDQADIQSALGAAAAVGDDRLQRMSTGHVSPETFTHGTSDERMSWFRKGFDTGSIAACNTFAQ
jgi:predicted metalloprotease